METIIAILILVVLLAFMAETLKVQISRKEGELIPNFSIDFKKDTRFYDLFKNFKSSDNSIASQINDEGYITESYFGKAFINYGENEASLLTRTLTIVATRNNLKSFSHYSADPNTRIKRNFGFKEVDSDFKKITEFDTWDGTTAEYPLNGLHKVILPISELGKGQKLKLEYDSEVFSHYKEVLPNYNYASHGFYFRFLTKTLSASLEWNIPKGQVTNVIQLTLLNQFKDKNVLERDFQVIPGTYNVEKFGVITITEQDNLWVITWNIPSEMSEGTVCRLRWQTERKEKI